jgi:hypothetical protein
MLTTVNYRAVTHEPCFHRLRSPEDGSYSFGPNVGNRFGHCTMSSPDYHNLKSVNYVGQVKVTMSLCKSRTHFGEWRFISTHS